MSNPLVNVDSGSDDEEQAQPGGAGGGAGHHPYSASYGFAATSWQLRKNLTETFNQHSGDDVECSSNNNDTSWAVAREAPHPRSVFHKIAQYEQKSARVHTNIATNKAAAAASAPSGKPPRQPQQPSYNAMSAATGDTSAKSMTTTTTTTKAGVDKRCLSVYLRVRPNKEGIINTIEIVPDDPPTKVRTHAPQRSNVAKMNRDPATSSSLQQQQSEGAAPTVVREFDFQRVFGPDQKTQDVYATVVAPMVDRMFSFPAATGGENEDDQVSNKEPKSGLLFAYGATNAGKTYSILGKLPSEKRDGATATKMDERHHGIVPRAFGDILDHMEHAKVRQPDQCYDLYLSYFEIYNENIYDLLEEQRDSNHPMFMREPLKLRESHKHTFVRGLSKRKISDVEQGLKLARLANTKRHTSSNNINTGSSRSHCICQLQVVRRPTHVNALKLNDRGSSATNGSSNGYNTDEEASQISRQKPTTLWVVDLAGSERSKRTNVGSLRQKEASLINKSLMNLMRCLSIMRENQSNTNASSNQVIPFRENKLTHLFMPIFTGRSASNISMIVNVNPAAPDFDETNHVLSYAAKAKMVQIEEKPTIARGPQNNAEEYGYNGRPIKKTKSAASKIASLVKKLSPKKLLKRANMSAAGKKQANEVTSGGDRKRKTAPPPARVPSFSASSTASITGSQKNMIPKTKRMRVVKPNALNAMQRSNSSSSLASTENEVKSLKVALCIAQAEVAVLKSEKYSLTEEMAHVETSIRQEVSEEMEEQLENTKRHYTNIIDQIKAQARQSVGVFEKRACEERAEDKIEVLVFKVEECEEEMKRQQESHLEDVSSLKEQHKEVLAAHQKEIQNLEEQLDKNSTTVAVGGGQDGVVEAQLLKIQEQEKELKALKKSKTDLIASYENLLANNDEEEEDDDDAGEDEEEEDDDDNDSSESSNDETDSAPAPHVPRNKKPMSRYMTRHRRLRSKGNANRGQRNPLSSISENDH